MKWEQFVVLRQRLIFCMCLNVHCPIEEVVQSSSKGVILKRLRCFLLYHKILQLKPKLGVGSVQDGLIS